MLEYQLKKLIESRPEIELLTNRGLETKDRKVIFYAKGLLDRFPNLMKSETKSEEKPKPKTKSKKKKSKAS